MELLTELAGHPERCIPAIHIAGSKGKGSVTKMIALILEASGYRPACYMSPHVNDFRERICLGGTFFDESVYCAAGEELRDVTVRWIPPDPSGDGNQTPNFFELMTRLC